ncbi:alpha/beta hydrolase [Sphingomonas paeninsulae]|jgi:acetyl esterase|uniref:Alpha/beta hydrolase n=1 Tax=Sphingomonas paeninsulae TaxID=2319844 RepID=A0A494TC82_SPHPE|nr:alpha/beta hydrolase [Sphingomonas paeninsulae]AYJ87047.1 alpha/beta hydrolase [Sphingomonas paeninsulae]
MIDPVLQQMIAAMAASGFALPDPLEATAMRAVMDNPFPGAPIPIAEVRDVEIAGSAGPIAARLYHPAPGEVRPVAILLHGGGWVLGTLETHDALARVLVRDGGCAVLSLDYRLAPEHPFPAAIDDVLAAIGALPAYAEQFGIRADRYAVVGDSAGGNLAAVAALLLAGKPNAPSGQVLFYPVVDRDFENASYRANPEDSFLTTGMMRFFWDQYLGKSPLDHRSAPLRAASLAGVAPATVILAGNDPLHDEGFDYAVALRAAGVPTDLHDFSGGIHGFASFFGVAPISDQAIAIAVAALRRYLS